MEPGMLGVAWGQEPDLRAGWVWCKPRRAGPPEGHSRPSPTAPPRLQEKECVREGQHVRGRVVLLPRAGRMVAESPCPPSQALPCCYCSK